MMQNFLQNNYVNIVTPKCGEKRTGKQGGEQGCAGPFRPWSREKTGGALTPILQDLRAALTFKVQNKKVQAKK